MAFSPDGKILASASGNMIRLWDTSTGKPVGTPLTSSTHIKALAFSPNGSTLAVGSSDGTARLWNLNRKQAIDRICTPGDNLTRSEWAAYLPQLPYNPPCPDR